MSSEADKEAGVSAQARVHVFAEGRAGAFRSAFASLFAPRSRGSLGLAGAQPGTGVRADDSVRNYLHKSLRSYSRRAGTGRIGTDARGDPHAAPLVDPAYLTDEADAPRLIAGVRRALALELRVHGMRGLHVADASIMQTSFAATRTPQRS